MAGTFHYHHTPVVILVMVLTTTVFFNEVSANAKCEKTINGRVYDFVVGTFSIIPTIFYFICICS